MKIVACNSNRPLAEAVAATLKLPLTRASIRRFADMEVFVEIHENVRGEDVFVMQPTSYPANDSADGVAGDAGCAAAFLGAADYRGHAVFRLCAAGPEDRVAHADSAQSW